MSNKLIGIVQWASIVAICAIAAQCAKSAELLPSAILLEVNHTSSASQHFGADPTNYGFSTVSGFLHWDIGKYGYLDIGDGHTIGAASRPISELHDVFQARAGVRINLWSKQ